MELFVDPGVVLLCEEFVVGVPGREEDLVGAGGGDEFDGEGPEFFFLFLEGRFRVGVVLDLVVKRLQVVQHVHRTLAAVAVLVRRVFLDVQAHDAEQHQADGDAFELEERRHERQDADDRRNEGNQDRHLVGDVVGREIEVGGIADFEAPLSDSLEEVLLSRGCIFSLHNWQNFRFLQSYEEIAHLQGRAAGPATGPGRGAWRTRARLFPARPRRFRRGPGGRPCGDGP